MSRNLCRTTCKFCGAAVVLTGPPRPIRREDCGAYFDEYKGMAVAEAACPHCEAQYLAWMTWPGNQNGRGRWLEPWEPIDLSFRSTFNDEPGPADMPKWRVEKQWVRVGPWTEETP